MQKSIVLTEEQKQILLKHASDCAPNESCAVLFGTNESGKNIVKEVFLTENIKSSPVSFRISADETIKAHKLAEEKKLEIVGIFHSHPNSDAYPSTTDEEDMDLNPYAWIIYSGETKKMKAFVLQDRIVEIPIIT